MGAIIGGKGREQAMKSRIFALLVAVFVLTGCGAEKPAASETTPLVEKQEGVDPVGEELVCVEYSSFSGAFPEDGTGRAVTDVAAMLVRNDSGRFLDSAVVECAIGGVTGTFKVTGLPAGASVWVMEQDGMQIFAGDSFEIIDCQDYAFRDDPVTQTDCLTVTSDGGTVTVTNVSADTLNNVCIYYKAVHSDGNYFGGITYMLAFDTLEPGQSGQKQSSHFGPDTKIVRYSFQTA